MTSAVSVRLLVVASLLFPVTSTAQSVVTKDDKAMAALSQAAMATGWNSTTMPSDVLANGLITYNRGDRQEIARVTLRSKGFDQVKAELEGSLGNRAIVISPSGAAVITIDGARKHSHAAATSLRVTALPIIEDLLAAQDTSVSVYYLGTEVVTGEACSVIKIIRSTADPHLPEEIRDKLASIKVWIAQSSLLPVQVEYPRIASTNSTASFQVRRTFSDYRAVGGIAVPFHQEEFIQGRLHYTLQLENVQFNAGLPDSDFALPTGMN